MMAIVMVVVMVMVIAMVFVVPVSFMNLPASLVVVVVGVAPVGAGIGRALPDSRDPDIAATAGSPIAVNPGVALSWHDRPYLVSHRWRCAEIDLDLAECRGCQGGCGDDTE